MKFSPLVLLLLINLGGISQSCCVPSSSDAFADLGKDGAFQTSHEEPIPFDFHGEGADFTFPVKGGEDGKGYIIRAEKPTTKYVFVFHEWWGLNDHIRKTADELYHELDNTTVICLDLYDGKSTDDRIEASALMQGADEVRIRSIVNGASEYVGPRAKVATIGWCFGGTWSMQASLELKAKAAGCIIYYGMPEQDLYKLGGLTTEVLGIFAIQDQWITPKIVSEFESALTASNIPHDIYSFEANHAFANPSNANHKKKAAKTAWEISVKFLKKQLPE